MGIYALLLGDLGGYLSLYLSINPSTDLGGYLEVEHGEDAEQLVVGELAAVVLVQGAEGAAHLPLQVHIR